MHLSRFSFTDNLESFGVGDSELEQKQVLKCFAKAELHLCCQVVSGQGEKKNPIRYISSIVSKWRIFPVINKNGAIGPNPAHTLTAKLVQTRWLGFGWTDQA